MDLSAKYGNNLLIKLEKLVKTAGMCNIDFLNKFTAIKIHFGEPGNLAYIRPNYVKKVVDIIKGMGGIAFLTDMSTLYTGKRSNAVFHLETACENGFNPLTVGCNVIIGDGLKGTDYKEIDINLKHIKKAKIGSVIADSDIIISMNHLKGHEMTGFGGAIKNLGMGSGSKNGKLEMHSSSKPVIPENKCKGCKACIKCCPASAIELNTDSKAAIDYNKCIGCGQCIAVCVYGAARVRWDETKDNSQEKIAEYAYAAIKDKPHFHINFIMDISPDCDCCPYNNAPIAPDIGIAASFDPVALDKACVDLINNSESAKEYYRKTSNIDASNDLSDFDLFTIKHPNTNWFAGLKHAQEIKLGNMDYEFIGVD